MRVRPLRPPRREPETAIERLLMDTLAAKGSMSPRVLVSFAACALYRQDLARDAALAEAGLFGENLFAPDVARALEAARGVLWSIEPRGALRSSPTWPTRTRGDTSRATPG